MNKELILWKSLPGFTKRFRGLANNTKAADEKFVQLFEQLRRDDRAILSFREMWNIVYYLGRIGAVEGDMAEFGVFRGGGAKLIHSICPNRKLFLFDSFAGMPDTDAVKDFHKRGDFSETSAQSVQDYLQRDSRYPHNIKLISGFFPQSVTPEATQAKFAFVHLDVDIYESTLAGLKFFYPRLQKGGILISHDYDSISCPGVKLAFNEFFAGSNQTIVPLWDTQCLVIKDN